MGLILALLACASPTVEEAAIPRLDAAAVLTRASLDLRGVRPSVAELDAVTEDNLDDAIEAMFADPGFEARVTSIYADIYLTRLDEWPLSGPEMGYDDEAAFVQSVGDEVPRFLGRVAATDAPWTDVLTADWTMADETLAAIWPIDRAEGAVGWQPSHYRDGRPAIGVLALNGLWWRYGTSASNLNRGRVNAISKTLLCNDYLSRDIAFDQSVDLSDEEAVREALQHNAGCVSCHVSLDPLAANLFPFYTLYATSAYDLSTWHPERQDMWQDTLGVAPGYFGRPMPDIWHLSRAIADDPRFPTCAVEQAFVALMQREPAVADADALTAHREAFLEGGVTLRALFRSVIESEAYRAAGEEGARKLVTPDLLASEVEGLTGYRLTREGWDILRNGAIGLHLLAGGADGQYVSKAADIPTVTSLLVQSRLAETAAAYVVAGDRADPAAARLFTVDFAATPETGRAAMLDQVRALHRAVLSTPAEDPEAEALLALWTDIYASDGDASSAWAGVLTALMRDPAFVVY